VVGSERDIPGQPARGFVTNFFVDGLVHGHAANDCCDRISDLLLIHSGLLVDCLDPACHRHTPEMKRAASVGLADAGVLGGTAGRNGCLGDGMNG